MTSSELNALSDACVVNKIKIRFRENPYKKVEDAIYEQMNAPFILRDNSLICEIDLSKHDIELLDKVAEKFISWDSKVKGIREDGVCFFTIENILKGIEEMKAEVSE